MRTQSTDAKRLQYKRDRPPTNADTPPEQHDQDSQRLPQVGNRQHHLCHLAQPADGRTSVKPIDDLCWAQSRVLDGRQPCGDPYARNNILAPALQPYYCAALLQCCNIQPTWAYAPAAWRGKRAEGTDCVAEALCRQNMLRMGLPLVMLRLQRGLENETFRFQTDLGRVVVDVRRRRALSPIAKLLIHSRKTIGSWEEPRDILDTTRTQTLPATMTTGRVSVSALDSLPDELILLILDQLDAGDYFTLRDLNATSSRFRRLTIDRLYRRFPGCSPEQFLRTIALSHPDERHEFMNYVKEVVWYQNYWDRLSRRRCLPLGDRHTVANILRSSGAILDTTDLSTDLPGRFIGFSSEYEVHWWYLEFFLFSTPKVEKITIHDAWQWDDHSYWFKSLAANPIHFENLRSITVFGPLRLRNIVPLLTLPSIHALDLTQVVDMRQEPDREFSWARDGEDYVDRRLASGSSLEHLVIRESDLHVPSAVGILGKLNKVKSFTYEHVCHELASHPGMQPSIFPWVGNLCWGPDSSLESLHLRIESSVVTHEEMTSLCHHVTGPVLAKLRTLNIGPCSVSTFKGLDLAQSEDLPTIASRIVAAFPDTLEALQIQWAYERDGEPRLKFFIDILRYLAEAIAGSDSKLKHVSIVDWPALAGWFPFQDQVISLKRAYERRGLQFDIVYEEIEDGEPLTVMEDVEPGWLWIQRTEYFATHCRFSRPSSNHG